ncbi:MAG: hypothetical protein ACREQI_10440 [Candidatus Binataceae bacterium]
MKFPSKITAKQFQKIAKSKDAIEALRKTGYPDEAKRVILNQITMAMVSDCLHHVFEALKCLEKRKVVVALNLLRKPLKDNFTYLSWILGDEDHFYREFTRGHPERLAQSRLGNSRSEIFSKAIDKTNLARFADVTLLLQLLFDRKNENGLEALFQHAVHLITVQRIELQTLPENFNFIFKNHNDDDVYYRVYNALPYVLLLLSHVVVGLFDRMKAMEKGVMVMFYLRSVLGFLLLEEKGSEDAQGAIGELLSPDLSCTYCKSRLRVSRHNAARLLMTESFRCTTCRRVSAFPFSWMCQDFGSVGGS